MLAATLPRILADRFRDPSARRGWPVWTHYAATVALVLAAYAARLALDGIYHLPFLTFIPAILAASLLFDRGSGLLATVLSAALASRFLAGPGDAPRIGSGDGTVALAAFVVFGLFTAALIEAFRAAVERLVEAERRARAAEARTGALLADMNHRFKNSLQAVGGLLHAEGKRVGDAAARAVLADAAGRLRVLGRLHDRLHLLGEGVSARDTVEMRGFLDGLCSDLRATLADGRPVAVRACADPISLSAAQAVPVGLIVNEAVTNALKHAFPGERPGSVTVRLRRQGERGLRLEIADDGVGLPGADAGAAVGGGTRLIRVLARQLNGHAAWHAHPGTAAVVTFPEPPAD
jgi:two-component system, sensor histidine kinase PdtaS